MDLHWNDLDGAAASGDGNFTASGDWRCRFMVWRGLIVPRHRPWLRATAETVGSVAAAAAVLADRRAGDLETREASGVARGHAQFGAALSTFGALSHWPRAECSTMARGLAVSSCSRQCVPVSAQFAALAQRSCCVRKSATVSESNPFEMFRCNSPPVLQNLSLLHDLAFKEDTCFRGPRCTGVMSTR